MGNFYANVTLRSTEADSIVQTLASLRRRAVVAPALGGATVVYDQAVDGP